MGKDRTPFSFYSMKDVANQTSNETKRTKKEGIVGKCEMDSANVGWQNLPKDLLEVIAERTSIRLLRAVCSSWRSSLFRPTNKSPLFSVKIPLPLFLQKARDKNKGGYFNLTERIIYCVQPPSDQNNLNDSSKSRKGWILKLEETFAGKMKLFHPLPKEEWLKWENPSPEELLKWENPLPRVLNLLDCRVFEVGKEYKLTWVHPQNVPRHKRIRLESHVKKVVMSSSDNAIMCIFGGRKLGYFKYGDENWYMIDDGLNETFDYSDIIHHKEKFYVIDKVGNTTVIDSLLNFKVIENQANGVRVRSTFVESNGDLFVVIIHFTSGYQFSRSRYSRNYFGGGENLFWLEICKFGSEKAEVADLCIKDDESCIWVPTLELYQCCYPGDPVFSDVVLFLPKDSNPRSILYVWPVPTWLKPSEV